MQMYCPSAPIYTKRGQLDKLSSVCVHKHLRTVRMTGFDSTRGQLELAFQILRSAPNLDRLIVDPMVRVAWSLRLDWSEQADLMLVRRMMAENRLLRSEYRHMITLLWKRHFFCSFKFCCIYKYQYPATFFFLVYIFSPVNWERPCYIYENSLLPELACYFISHIVSFCVDFKHNNSHEDLRFFLTKQHHVVGKTAQYTAFYLAGLGQSPVWPCTVWVAYGEFSPAHPITNLPLI